MENKVNINDKEYEISDLSEVAKELITILSIADNNIRKHQAELVVLQKGRDVLVNDLINEVEIEVKS